MTTKLLSSFIINKELFPSIFNGSTRITEQHFNPQNIHIQATKPFESETKIKDHNRDKHCEISQKLLLFN